MTTFLIVGAVAKHILWAVVAVYAAARLDNGMTNIGQGLVGAARLQAASDKAIAKAASEK